MPQTGLLYSNQLTDPTDMNRLRFDIHRGTWDHNYTPNAFHGDHDTMCGPPTTTRDLDEGDFAGLVWYCGTPAVTNPHVMTGMNTESYNIISIAPLNGGTPVWPATATRFCFNVNRTDLAGRKWINIDVISEARFHANGDDLSYVTTGFEANRGNPIETERPATDPLAQIHTSEDFSLDRIFGLDGDTDKASRLQICVKDNGDGTVTATEDMPGTLPDVTRIIADSFPAGPRVFIIQDESYHPDKACAEEGDCPAVVDPYSWHFDDVTVGS